MLWIRNDPMKQERFIDLVRVEQETLRRFQLVLCGGDSSLANGTYIATKRILPFDEHVRS